MCLLNCLSCRRMSGAPVSVCVRIYAAIIALYLLRVISLFSLPRLIVSRAVLSGGPLLLLPFGSSLLFRFDCLLSLALLLTLLPALLFRNSSLLLGDARFRCRCPSLLLSSA